LSRGGAYSAPSDPLAGFRGKNPELGEKGEGNGLAEGNRWEKTGKKGG